MPFDIGDHVRINEDGLKETGRLERERLAGNNELVVVRITGNEYWLQHVDIPEREWSYYYYETELELIDSRYPPNVVRMPTKKKADV